jgi:hypothetical protein
MTTIAYRDGVMAGDGRETTQNDDDSSVYVVRDNCVKVWRLPDGGIFGAAHGSEDIERLKAALFAGHPPPKLDSIAGLWVKPDGSMWLYEGHIWQSLKGLRFYAVGSGGQYALAAMRASTKITARQACAVGADMDPYSGGVIRTVRLRKRR